MNLIYKLVSFLGSPFKNEEHTLCPFTSQEKVELYNLAYKNKIGLFFLDQLAKIGEIHPFEETYTPSMERFIETNRTALILSSKIKKITNDFAVFKFVKPYPNTPSDVDVLFFLSKKDYLIITNYLIDNGYYKIGESPSQVVMYDLRGGYRHMDTRVVEGKKGGKYYIDLYKDVGASHFIYISKETLKNYITEINYQNGSIQTLHPIADLPVVLTHSIIPEQLFTLADFYTTLNYLKNLKNTEIDKTADIFIRNNVTSAGIASLTLTGKIHENIFGFIPEKVSYLYEAIGGKYNLSQVNLEEFTLPYRYEPSIIIRVLLERMKNRRGFESMAVQSLFTLDPRLLKWVVYNIVLRRKRETY